MPPEVAAITDPAPANPANPAPVVDPNAAVPPAKPSRPDGLPDAYWNDETGVAFDKLVPDFTALSDLKARQDERAAAIPEKPEDYELALPEGFELPQGMEFKIDDKDPLAAEVRAWAKAQGLTKDEFKGVLALEAKRQIAEHTQLSELAAAERVKLGSQAGARLDALTAWAKATIGQEHADALLPMMFTSKQVEAFEKIMAAAKAAGPKLTTVREGDAPPEMTEDAWNAMSPTQKIEWGRAHPARKTS